MANTGYATQPQMAPPHYGPPRRSLAGPLILIVIGVLFLLGNLRVLPWQSLGHYFARYWPALLIIWGIIKLVEYFVAQREGRRSAALGVGGVFLLIFLIIGGLIATGVEKVNWQGLHDNVDWGDNDVWGNMFGRQFTFEQALEQDFPAGGTLHVSSDRGSVTVNTWDQNRIKVEVAKKLRAQDQDEANKHDAATQAQLSNNGNEFTLNANTHGAGAGSSAESDLEIYLPANASVDIATRRGDVNVTNRTGNVQVNNSKGDVTLEDIKGNATLALRRGTLRASKINGDVIVDGAVDDAHISDVSGALRMNGGAFDTMELAHIGKNVSYQSSRTTLEFAKLDGELTLQGGNLNGNQLTGPVRLTTRSKDIHLEDVSGSVQVENSNGLIEIHAGKLPLGAMQMSNRRGDVRLVLPANAGFQLDARTRRGEINSDFGMKVENSGGENKASGAVGGGGPRVEIQNEGGDVEIRKLG